MVFALFAQFWTQYGLDPQHSRLQPLGAMMAEAPKVKWTFNMGYYVESWGPNIVDIDGDGRAEVLVGDISKLVVCVDGATGAEKWRFIADSEVVGSFLCEDVDGDGKREVVLADFKGSVFCLRGEDGSLLWKREFPAEFWASPVGVDLDGDSLPEIILCGLLADSVWALDGDGSTLWSARVGSFPRGSPAAGDVDGDGEPEILITSDGEGTLVCLSHLGEEEWSLRLDSCFEAPSIGDVDADGEPEICLASHSGYVYAISGDGKIEWVHKDPSTIICSPTILPGGGLVYGDSLGRLTRLSTDGSVVWVFPTGVEIHRAPVLCDVDGDGRLEVLHSTHYGPTFWAVDLETGTPVWSFTAAFDVHGISVGDIDGDGCSELVFGTQGVYKLWALDDPHGGRGCWSWRPLELPGAWVHGRTLYLEDTLSLAVGAYDVLGRKLWAWKGISDRVELPDNLHGLLFLVIQLGEFRITLVYPAP